MILFPMAGLSSRFFKANYKIPKYMLPIYEKTVLHAVVKSFEKYFEKEKFIFILVDNEFEPKKFVLSVLNDLNIKNFEIIVLKDKTRGQAETVFLGLERLNIDKNEPLTIFNVDTFRPGFTFPSFVNEKNVSYLETFIGSGKNWSNVVPKDKNSDEVLSTSEKQEASEYCCTGLYHWETADLFIQAYIDYEKVFPDKELYVAPMYNYAINKKYTVKYSVIPYEEVIFCGTPEEYESLLKK